MQDEGGLIEPSFEVPFRLEPLPPMVTLPTNIGYQTRPPGFEGEDSPKPPFVNGEPQYQPPNDA